MFVVFGVLRVVCESESFVQNNNYDLTSDYGVIKLSHRLLAEYSYKQLGSGGRGLKVGWWPGGGRRNGRRFEHRVVHLPAQKGPHNRTPASPIPTAN